jgi:hypothetical protein
LELVLDDVISRSSLEADNSALWQLHDDEANSISSRTTTPHDDETDGASKGGARALSTVSSPAPLSAETRNRWLATTTVLTQDLLIAYNKK